MAKPDRHRIDAMLKEMTVTGCADAEMRISSASGQTVYSVRSLATGFGYTLVLKRAGRGYANCLVRIDGRQFAVCVLPTSETMAGIKPGWQ